MTPSKPPKTSVVFEEAIYLRKNQIHAVVGILAGRTACQRCRQNGLQRCHHLLAAVPLVPYARMLLPGGLVPGLGE